MGNSVLYFKEWRIYIIMENFIFFVKGKNEQENLLLYHCNKMMEISKLLFNIFGDNNFFMEYLLITNYEGIVESFTSDNIIVNYENIQNYIKNNVFDKKSLKNFFIMLINQSDSISGNKVADDYEFRKQFEYLFSL